MLLLNNQKPGFTSVVFGFLGVLLFLSACQPKQSGNQVTEIQGTPILTISQKSHDFGDVAEGEEVGVVFWARNDGHGSLLITHVKAGCGCTSVKWPKEPIAPGDSGRIDVLFDTRGRQGLQSKQVLVYSNATEAPLELLFTARIK
ncbi:MAG: DUF1573 domain-containing protein [Marinilabiliaceae bacterium]|nr:DUF1573 domain-containing protein [Marinilabiliaceae bacterium]